MKNYVKDERIKRNLTQVQLAELVSVSRQTIISIESSRYLPSILLVLKIARVLDKPVESLFDLEKGD